MADLPEVWLRGPIDGIPAALQPVAHSLIQAREEVEREAPGLSQDVLWKQAGAATVGFHLVHMAGALDRLFTYARGEALTDEQRAAAKAESNQPPEVTGQTLSAVVAAAVERALAQLRATDVSKLAEERRVGRTATSTLGGILFHAAEHTTRHAGQFITTVKLLQGKG
jgi:uncharacterized damage-inducible protein DinB